MISEDYHKNITDIDLELNAQLSTSIYINCITFLFRVRELLITRLRNHQTYTGWAKMWVFLKKKKKQVGCVFSVFFKKKNVEKTLK